MLTPRAWDEARVRGEGGEEDKEGERERRGAGGRRRWREGGERIRRVERRRKGDGGKGRGDRRGGGRGRDRKVEDRGGRVGGGYRLRMPDAPSQ